LWRDNLSVREAFKIYRSTNQLDDLRNEKSSNTLAILGSGGSINEISEKEWDFISSIDSLALNWWGVYHDFVPSFYQWEAPGDDLTEFWIEEMNKKRDLYANQNVTLIFDPERMYGMKENVAEILDKIDPSLFSSLVDIRLAIYYSQKNSGFGPEVKFAFPTLPFTNRLLHSRGSLSQAIAIGAHMGYDDIILFGVDLNNSEYFFSTDPKSHKSTDQGKDPEENHATAKRDQFKPIDEYVCFLNETILEETEMSIGTKNSLLFPRLDYYEEKFEI